MVLVEDRGAGACLNTYVNGGCIVSVLECESGVWFSDLMDRSGFKSVSFFKRSLCLLLREGVVVEVKRGYYALKR